MIDTDGTTLLVDAAGGREFRLTRCLGEGGFGAVYLALVRSAGGLQQQVAVKLLRPDVEAKNQGVERLRDEAHLLASLRHPVILAAHDLVVLGDRVALVTEYVEGQDLREILHDRRAPMPSSALVDAVGQVAGALDAAWTSAGIVHRDIKPANIRIGRHGNVKLMDFGIAISDIVTRSAHTQGNIVMGSLSYLAPERFDVDEQPHPASDVFSLGCVLFEGVTRHRLFHRLDAKRLFALTRTADVFAMYVDKQLSRDMPEGIRALLRRMFALDPDARPTAAEVARECDRLTVELPERLTLRMWARERVWPGGAPETPGPEGIGGPVPERGPAARPGRSGPRSTPEGPPPRANPSAPPGRAHATPPPEARPETEAPRAATPGAHPREPRPEGRVRPKTAPPPPPSPGIPLSGASPPNPRATPVPPVDAQGVVAAGDSASLEGPPSATLAVEVPAPPAPARPVAAPAAPRSRAWGRVAAVSVLGASGATVAIVALASIATVLGLVWLFRSGGDGATPVPPMSRDELVRHKSLPRVPVEAVDPPEVVPSAPAPNPGPHGRTSRADPADPPAEPPAEPPADVPPPEASSPPAPAGDAAGAVAADGEWPIVLRGVGPERPVAAGATIELPAGRYDVWVDFGKGPLRAGEVTVAGGATATVRCNAIRALCTATP